MDAGEHNGVESKPAKRAGGRPRRRVEGKAPEGAKRSLNLRIDEDSYEKLSIHAVHRRTTISELVMDLARTHLREVYLQRYGSRGEG